MTHSKRRKPRAYNPEAYAKMVATQKATNHPWHGDFFLSKRAVELKYGPTH